MYLHYQEHNLRHLQLNRVDHPTQVREHSKKNALSPSQSVEGTVGTTVPLVQISPSPWVSLDNAAQTELLHQTTNSYLAVI